MAGRYLETLFTPEVLAEQQHYYGRSQVIPPQPDTDPLGVDERAFIESRDSFYMATITSNGWPYLQHRGGPPGFLVVAGPNQLAFADFKGNRQLISTGNLKQADRVSLFLMDYPRRERLKILGHGRVEDARQHPELVTRFAPDGSEKVVERVFLIDVVSYDWNCPKYITPRYTASEVEQVTALLKQRISELEEQLKTLGSH
ncbi:MAG: pyridoxamine 5'-phosphate oxidase family protein [Puniceicoccaceae bacterium]